MGVSSAVALSIAGSDSGGGAGIQADLRTFAALGVFGCSVVTSLTAQNPCEVRKVLAIPPGMVLAQLSAVIDKFDVRAVKTGMLGTRALVLALAPELAKLKIPLVIDPVMFSTSGASLLAPAALKPFQERVLPLAAWMTPNIPEAEFLAQKRLVCVADIKEAALTFSSRWHCGCILKGGHLSGKEGVLCDIVAFEGKSYQLSGPALSIRGHSSHGTGCTLSSAFAAGLAKGYDWDKALCRARAFVCGSLAEALPVGKGIRAMFPPTRGYLSKIRLQLLS
ncbi:MAG: bifunctional hydroxymethylpyrimidine kinase/phosphomethylpyrimidine kinase [Lentisphaerae bacterium GWF2_52_8]|nr:MAG: bifunctional hydroxymethylpyrimidine kinase/phosphomethylpyrimidine kinase [Lentisphaerae bacterium GWF2_52_8]